MPWEFPMMDLRDPMQMPPMDLRDLSFGSPYVPYTPGQTNPFQVQSRQWIPPGSGPVPIPASLRPGNLKPPEPLFRSRYQPDPPGSAYPSPAAPASVAAQAARGPAVPPPPIRQLNAQQMGAIGMNGGFGQSLSSPLLGVQPQYDISSYGRDYSRDQLSSPQLGQTAFADPSLANMPAGRASAAGGQGGYVPVGNVAVAAPAEMNAAAMPTPGAPLPPGSNPTGMAGGIVGGAAIALPAGVKNLPNPQGITVNNVMSQQNQQPASMWSWDNPDAWNTVINGVGTLGSLGLGTAAFFQGLNQYEFQKDLATRNFNNQVQSYNDATADRVRGRSSRDSRASEDAEIARRSQKKK